MPANGLRYGEDFTIGQNITFMCQPGYTMEAESFSTITCTGNGTWNAPVPFCKGKTIINYSFIINSDNTLQLGLVCLYWLKHIRNHGITLNNTFTVLF